MRARRILLLSMSLLLVATACGGAEEEVEKEVTPTDAATGPFSLAKAAEPYKGTEIRVLDEITDLQPGFYENVVPEFERQTGIKVNWELQSHFDVITVGEADLFSGAGTYDSVMLHRQQFPNALLADAIEFLDPYFNDPNLHDPSVDFSNFISVNVEGSSFGDNTVCFPDWDYNFVWIGRKDLMQHPDEQAAFKAKYGYDLAPPETLQQMRDIGEFFTRQPGDTLAGETVTEPFYGFVQDGSRLSTTWMDVWVHYIKQFGGDLFDENGAPTANLPENVKGLEFWKSMFEFAPPGAAEINLLDLPVILGQGRVASMIGFSDFFFTVDSPGGSPVAGQLVYAPVPYNADSPNTRFSGVPVSCLVINAASENKEATYLFLQWIVSQEAQDAYLEQSLEKGGFDPVLKSSLQHPDFTGGPRANLNAAIAGSLSVGFTWPLHKDFLKTNDAMLQRFQEFLLGQKTAQEALDALQQDLEKICPSDCLIQP